MININIETLKGAIVLDDHHLNGSSFLISQAIREGRFSPGGTVPVGENYSPGGQVTVQSVDVFIQNKYSKFTPCVV